MNRKEAAGIGREITPILQRGDLKAAYDLLEPILAQKTSFLILEEIGKTFGKSEVSSVNALLEIIAERKKMGGWVIIGGALREQLDRDPEGAFTRAKRYIIRADVWYGTDILGERVPGPGLVSDFEESIRLLRSWRGERNRWVRRGVGVAVHFWAKRSRGGEKLKPKAEALLDLLGPLFSEWEMDAVKGIGWGLKTLGKYYPDLLFDWLSRQLQWKHRAILYRKAITYLSDEQREALKLVKEKVR
jgi:hypothetical protein